MRVLKTTTGSVIGHQYVTWVLRERLVKLETKRLRWDFWDRFGIISWAFDN